jgi:cytochrome c2
MRRLTCAPALIFAAALSCTGCGIKDSGRLGDTQSGDARHGGRHRELREARALIVANCVACHRVPSIAGANGRVGPSLDGISRQQILAGHFSNSPEAMTAWIEHPQHLLPGDAMPETGLSHDQVTKIVDYLYTME